jgi:2OG-Fe dioxygenase
MPDDSSRRLAGGLEAVRAALRDKGYALTSDRAIGLPEGCREHLSAEYYNSGALRHDKGDFPEDRERARDVVRYTWSDDEAPRLKPFERITLTDRAGIPGRREHSRVQLLEDPETEQLISTLLQLVPPERRQPEGTFGINLFRTYTNVVTTPHHDNEQFVLLYVIDRIGDGAETYLYNPDDVSDDGEILAEPVLTQQLNPGDIIIFEDKRYKHGATPLVSLDGGSTRRDAFVCTFDYFDSYLGQAAAS